MLGTGLPDGDVEIEKQSFLPSGSPWSVLWEGGYLQPTLQAGVGWGGTLSSIHFSLNSLRHVIACVPWLSLAYRAPRVCPG